MFGPVLLKDRILPLYVPAKIALIAPYTLNVKTGVASVSLAGACHSIIVAVAYYIFHLYSAYGQMQSQRDSNFITKLIDSYNQYAGCTILLIIVLTANFYQRDMVRVVALLNRIDSDLMPKCSDAGFSPVGGHYEQSLWRWILEFYTPAYLFMASLCVMEFYFCIMFIKDMPTFSAYCLAMCYVPLLVHCLTELMFCAHLLAVTNRVQHLNRLLIATISSSSSSSSSAHQQRQVSAGSAMIALNSFKRTFDSLLQCASTLNRIYRVPLLLLIFHQFTAITSLTYDLAVSVLKYDQKLITRAKIIDKLESSGGWTLFFIAESFALCLYCEYYKNTMRRAQGQLLRLCEALGSNHTQNERWRRLQIVAHCRRNTGTRISACALFQVDLGMFYAMVGIITTYLIILVQFDISQQKQSNQSVSVANGTDTF